MYFIQFFLKSLFLRINFDKKKIRIFHAKVFSLGNFLIGWKRFIFYKKFSFQKRKKKIFLPILRFRQIHASLLKQQSNEQFFTWKYFLEFQLGLIRSFISSSLCFLRNILLVLRGNYLLLFDAINMCCFCLRKSVFKRKIDKFWEQVTMGGDKSGLGWNRNSCCCVLCNLAEKENNVDVMNESSWGWSDWRDRKFY